ncbi:MAG: PaaI family thioesterase [Actinobacteria bacterium]|nr:PaaI family thioesterase [Actinomycetota bacterium]
MSSGDAISGDATPTGAAGGVGAVPGASAPNHFGGFHVQAGPLTAADQARVELADEVRAMIREIISTDANPDDIRRARDHVRSGVELLLAKAHGVAPGVSEAALIERSRNFLARSPMMGSINPIAMPLIISTVHEGEHATVEARVTFSRAYEGAPGCVHGGFVASAFDEVLGVAQSASGNPGMTANLSVDYRSPTPILHELVFRGWCERIDGRKIYTRGTVHHGDTLCAEATALFLSMRPELFAKLLAMRDASGSS